MAKPRPHKRKPLYPLPVEDLFRHPAYIALPCAARGMLLSLIEHFWRTDCRPMPLAEDQLFAIARAHRPTWRHHKAHVLEVFADVSPGMRAYFDLREAKGTSIGFASAKGGATMKARAAHKRLENSLPAPSSRTSLPVTDGRLPPRTPAQAQPRPAAKPVHTDRRA